MIMAITSTIYITSSTTTTISFPLSNVTWTVATGIMSTTITFTVPASVPWFTLTMSSTQSPLFKKGDMVLYTIDRSESGITHPPIEEVLFSVHEFDWWNGYRLVPIGPHKAWLSHTWVTQSSLERDAVRYVPKYNDVWENLNV